jgi:biotin carboxyl carrier protein
VEGSDMAIKEFVINGKTMAVEILEQHPAYFKFRINNKIFEVSLEKHNPTEQTLDLIINNNPIKIKSIKPQDAHGDNLLLYIANYCTQVLVEPIKQKFGKAADETKSTENLSNLNTDINQTVKSPLAGRIVKIFVKPGDQVIQNQPLLIIESMKMENEIRAISHGIIKSISIEEGNLVQQNQVLIIFE